jgi:hypothetical protein
MQSHCRKSLAERGGFSDGTTKEAENAGKPELSGSQNSQNSDDLRHLKGILAQLLEKMKVT